MRTVVSVKTVLALLLLAVVSTVQAAGLTDFQGNPQKLENHLGKGKWTVLMFWASDCHICNLEAHEYVAFQEKHKDGNIRMLGLTMDGMDNIEAARAFVAEHQLNFTNLIADPETVSGLYYDLTGDFFYGTPSIIVFNPAGESRGGQAGAIPPKYIEDFINNESVASND